MPADEQPPVFRLTSQICYEVSSAGEEARLVADFGVFTGDSGAFGALAKAAGRAVWAVRDWEFPGRGDACK